jgi:hypothetical protein
LSRYVVTPTEDGHMSTQDDHGGLHRWLSRGGRIVPALAVVGAGALALAVVKWGGIDLPDWFGGGRSDPAPRGSVIYEGQEAKTASEHFLIDIGDGEAVVAVQAKQNWDRAGWLINGDFQSTNGTSSVADPKDRDRPARLAVTVDYCANGVITTIETRGDDPVTAIRFEMGRLYVCDAALEHSAANDSAFKQDDTPNDFHGSFVSFVASAAETTAAASACPTDELGKYRTMGYRTFVREQLAERFRLPVANVDVVAGRIGGSDSATQRELRADLESFANMRDPDDPSTTYEALTIQYLSGNGEAVTDSCYQDAGGRELDDLGNVRAPDPEDR